MSDDENNEAMDDEIGQTVTTDSVPEEGEMPETEEKPENESGDVVSSDKADTAEDEPAIPASPQHDATQLDDQAPDEEDQPQGVTTESTLPREDVNMTTSGADVTPSEAQEADDEEDNPKKKMKRLKKKPQSDSDDDGEQEEQAGGSASKDATDEERKRKKEKKEAKKKEQMTDLFGDDDSDDDDMDAIQPDADEDLDMDNIVEGKRGQPSEKKSKKHPNQEAAGIEDEGGVDDFLDDDDLDDNMKKVVEEYNEEGNSPAGSEAEEENDDEERQRRNDEAYMRKNDKDDIDRMLGKSKATKSRKTRSEELRKDDAIRFIERIRDAAETDSNDMAKNKPALAKLRMLSEIQAAMMKKDMIGILMDNDILGVLKLFIIPIDEQGTLPSLNLRVGILDILLSQMVLSITEVWQLEKSRIGEDVYRLKDHPKETRENRRKAARLVERWYRMLTGTSESMMDMGRDPRMQGEQQAAPEKKRRKVSTSADADIMERNRSQAGSWMQVRIPFPESMAYARRPETSADVKNLQLKNVKGKKEDDKSKADLMRDKLKRSGKKKGSGTRAEDVSIEGRGMEKFI